MIAPEFSRIVSLDKLGPKDKRFTLEADAKERQALAKRLGIPEVKAMSAEIAVKMTHAGQRVILKGRVKAELVQICVVTLEPTEQTVDEEFTRVFSNEPQNRPAEVVIDMEEEDPPEPVEDGQIDMGEAAAEHLALAMDPFPRAPGVSYEPPPEMVAESSIAEPAKSNPFEVLAEHRKKL